MKPNAAHGSVRERDSRPQGSHDDGPVTGHHGHHAPSKAMAMLSRALKPDNSGNPSCAEHNKICSHHGRVPIHKRPYG
jgi:hypothetical protein